MNPAPRSEWLDSPEAKEWLVLSLMTSDAKNFTRFTIIMIIGALTMRINGVPDHRILFTLVIWVPVIAALKSVSAARAKQKFLDHRKRMAQK